MGLNAKELKSLSRGDLLELLLAQTERVEELEQEREELKKKVDTKDIFIEKSGTLAEAALAINRVFQAADQAAAQYLSNIMRLYDAQLEKGAKLKQEYSEKPAVPAEDGIPTEEPQLEEKNTEESLKALADSLKAQEEETVAKCESMLRETTEKCKTMVQEATAKCDAMVQEAAAKCGAMKEETQLQCAEAELASQTRCREAEETTEQACEELKRKAQEEADAYWEKIQTMVKRYVASHPELKSLLRTKG